MHIKKTLTLKGTKKSEEKPELQKRKSNLFNEKLELIKISKYTQKKNIHTQQHDVLTHRGKSSGPRPLNMACQLKEKTQTYSHARTHTHAQAHKKQEPSIFQRYTQSTTNTNSELFYNASFLNTKDAHLGCIYIYIYLFFSGLLLTYF